ncbi:hypothetical protein GGQ88_003909 [Novosphingobium hassiacum]|jgi:hypothetical protein|uniref:Uncharacterized protein n=1 Tax=Novosphingobium hassiacum TaxID=173676 RepID=A0A7W6EXP7_9SPHN|nr:hypothetical protein [Novosphingobium hassiacum]MBB3862607.1 hypothetical protein [Novosphingobium hassiacum]
MTAGKTDRPAAGHILRYVYLFEEEQRQGRDEGVKERFVVIVGVEGSRYLVAAITTKGEGRKNAIVIPDEIARTAGLAPGSAIVISEFNRFTWPGFDIRPLMKQPGYIAGRLPPRFTAKIIDAIAAWRAAPVDRD